VFDSRGFTPRPRVLPDMQQLTPAQLSILDRVAASGFAIVAFPLYASAIGVRRGSFAALLVPVEPGGLGILGAPCYLIDGNLSVRVTRKGRRVFAWKNREVEATPELLAELRQFAADVAQLLVPVV
jgi:hypothetical protein